MSIITVKLVGRGSPLTIQFGGNEAEPGILHSKTSIYPDDTIVAIKQKIIGALQQAQQGIPNGNENNDLYLFTTVYRREVDPTAWTQSIQRRPAVQQQVLFKQVLSNLGYSQSDIEEKSVPLPLDTTTPLVWEHWDVHRARIPLGLRHATPPSTDAFFFPVHPLEAYVYEEKGGRSTEWAAHQNEVLLEYGEMVEPILHACFYEDIPTEHRSHYGYVPTRSIKITSALHNSWKKQEKLQAVYDWTLSQRTGALGSFGITLLEMEWIYPQYAVLPLEIMFKNVHAYTEVPYIKWNALYRVYCPTRDERGNKVPVLSKQEMAKIERENIHTHLTLWTPQGITLYILKNGNIQIRVQPTKASTPDEIRDLIQNIAGPILRQMNEYLQKTGFSFPLTWLQENDLFRNDPTTIKIRNLHWMYSAKIPVDASQQALPKKHLLYLDPAFVVYAVDNEKRVSEAQLNYRRVSNYDPAHELKDMLRLEFAKKTPLVKRNAFLAELRDRGFSAQKIQETVQEVLEEIQAGKQPFQKKEKRYGCPMRMERKYDDIRFTVDNIPFVQNLDLLKMYVETFLTLSFSSSQLPNTLFFPPPEETTSPLPIENLVTKPDETIPEEEETGDTIPSVGPDEDDEETTGVLLYDEDDDDDNEDDVDVDVDVEEKKAEEELKDIIKFKIPEVEESPTFLGGAKKSKPSFSILHRLQERQPEIFNVPDKNGKGYSRICPGSSSRYPIVLSKEEKTRIDKKDGELQQVSYTDPLEYKGSVYVCPRYWNFRENRSMSQAEFDRNPTLSQHLIVDEKDADNDANDRYIYEFKKGKRIDKNGQYKEHVPGFSSKNKNGFCLPCCFSEKDKTFHKNIQECTTENENIEENEEIEKTEVSPKPIGPTPSLVAPSRATQTVANAKYILGINIYPLEAERWGHIPPPIQSFMQSIPVTTSSTPSKNLLRYGVERKENQSFFACLANLLDLSVEETKNHLTTQVLTLDKFVQYQTGAVASRFRRQQHPDEAIQSDEPDTEKYQETAFYKSLDLENPDEYQFLLETLKTYEQFVAYLHRDDVIIDPTYLWDVIATPDENLFVTGLNIIVFEIVSNEDTTVTLMCPTNLYSNTEFYDATKPTWILIKRPLLSGEDYYEPIYSATLKTGIRGAQLQDKVFMDEFIQPIFPFFKTLDKSTCFETAHPRGSSTGMSPRKATAEYVTTALKKRRFQLLQQVVNRYGKTVGFLVEKKPVISGVYVPCFPSIALPDIERIRLDKAVLQKPLATTTDNLQYIEEQTGLPCSVKTLVATYGEASQIIGIKTGYQGYVPVVPVAVDPRNTLPVEYSSDPIEAEIATQQPADEENPSQMYFLEKEFFLAFQGKMRNLLNEYENEAIRKKIVYWSHYKPSQQQGDERDRTAPFVLRYNRVLALLQQAALGKIIFNDFDKRVLSNIHRVYACQTDLSKQDEPQPYCVLRSGTEGDKMVFPKRNLVNSAEDNEVLYFSKLADALVRNSRIQNIVFQPYRFFNLLGSVDYQVNENELLLGAGA